MAQGGRDTEFEEDSFEDEFEPEEEMAQYKNVPKPQPKMVPPRGTAQARQLAALLQRNVSLQSRQPPLLASTSSSAVTDSDVMGTLAVQMRSESSSLASALAAAIAGARDLDGDDDDITNFGSPKSLKTMSAEFLLLLTGKDSLAKQTIPGHLYTVLLAAAARTQNEDAIIHLVSTWPSHVLDLNEVDIPLDYYVHRETPTSPCVSDFIIKGLLYRKRKFCNLQMVVLPKNTVIGVQILANFARLPYHYCSRLPNLKIPQILSAGKLKESLKYIQEIPKLNLKREINFYSYIKGNVKLVIAVPVAVVHWLGRKANVNDVHAALLLQKHSPFVFHFDNIALINFVDTPAISVILDLIDSPEKVKKLLLKNKRVFRPDHVSYVVSSLSVSLRRFKGLRGFFTKLSALVGYGPDDFVLTDEHRNSIADVFRSWPQLTRLNFNEQPIDVPGSFAALFAPIIGRLTKLSLVRAKLTPDDVKLIADSPQVETLELLRLDYNDLNAAADQIVELLSRLRSIKTLRMQACHVKYRNCLRFAAALAESRTLRTWNFTDNVMFKVRHIKEFVELCANIVSLRAVGCRPLEYHVLLGKVVVPTKKGLSDSKRRELDEFAESLNLVVF